jgi:hypothetical protein
VDFFSGSSDARGDDPEEDDDEPEHDVPDWFGPPSSVMGGVVPIDARYRDRHVFVGLAGVSAYPTGLSFTLELGIRRGDWSRERWDEVQDRFWGHERQHRRSRRGERTDELRIGVELADGRRGTGEGRQQLDFSRDVRPEAPVIVEQGGGGSGGARTLHASRDVWVWPLPPGDYLDLVIEWHAMDVPLTRFRLDAAAVRAAADRSQPYWT